MRKASEAVFGFVSLCWVEMDDMHGLPAISGDPSSLNVNFSPKLSGNEVHFLRLCLVHSCVLRVAFASRHGP